MPSSALPDSSVASPTAAGSGFFSTLSRNAPDRGGCPRRRCRPRKQPPRSTHAPTYARSAVSKPWACTRLELERSRIDGSSAPSSTIRPTWLREQVGVRRPDRTCRRTRRSRSACGRRAPRAARRGPWPPRRWTCAGPGHRSSSTQPSPSRRSRRRSTSISAGVSGSGSEAIRASSCWVALALQRVLRADPARVEPDDVEGRAAARAEGGVAAVRGVVDARSLRGRPG